MDEPAASPVGNFGVTARKLCQGIIACMQFPIDSAGPSAEPSMHVYQREVHDDGLDSLSMIARLIAPDQSLLDLGMGVGGLGQYLSQRQRLVADGVTLNPAEEATR